SNDRRTGADRQLTGPDEPTQKVEEPGNSAAKFSAIDSYVHERLAILASTKHGLKGRNWDTRSDHEWCTKLGVHRLTGRVRYTSAYASR
ncbi:MAG: hypothetical protein ACLP50_06200, partial [Solirubrobacteraceae bacterium]